MNSPVSGAVHSLNVYPIRHQPCTRISFLIEWGSVVSQEVIWFSLKITVTWFVHLYNARWWANVAVISIYLDTIHQRTKSGTTVTQNHLAVVERSVRVMTLSQVREFCVYIYSAPTLSSDFYIKFNAFCLKHPHENHTQDLHHVFRLLERCLESLRQRQYHM